MRARLAARAWLVAGASVCGVLYLAVALHSLRLLEQPFPGFLVWDNGTLVSFHQASWTGATGDLPLNGGLIVSVEGRPFEDGSELLATVGALPVGTPLRYTIRFRGEVESHDVPSMRLSPSSYLATFGVYLLNGAAFLLIAFVALALRPKQRVARALAAATLCMGLLFTLAIDYFSGYRLLPLYLLVEGLTPASLWALLLVFPVERCSSRTWRIITLAGVASGACIALTNLLVYQTHPGWVRGLTYAVNVMVGMAGLTMVASFGNALLRAETVHRRVQSFVIFTSGAVAIVLPAIALIVFFVLGWTISFSWIGILLPVFPLAMLYAVVRHDLLGVERFARLTTGYVLATSAVILVYAVVVLVLDQVLEGAAGNPAVSFVLLIAIAIGFNSIRTSIQDVVDRLFYRSRVDPALVLERISAELAGVAQEEAVRRLVADRLAEALDLEWCSFHTDEDTDEPSNGSAWSEEVLFQGQASGTIRCGPKSSGAPFSGRETDLISGVAAQAALAMETARSMADLQATQEVLVRTERLAAMGELAGSVAHGLRNPLAGIRATAQGALDDARAAAPEDDDAGRQAAHADVDRSAGGGSALRAILGDVDRLDQRIGALLDFSRPFEPRIQSVDLCELLDVVRDIVERRATRAGIEVSLSKPEAPLRVNADPDHVEEVLLELSGNSLRVLGPGDSLRFEATERREGGATLRVTDTGPGIPPRVRHRIFELFFTTRPGGTGLGLASVRKIISRMGGSIALEDTATGTSFRIELPG